MQWHSVRLSGRGARFIRWEAKARVVRCAFGRWSEVWGIKWKVWLSASRCFLGCIAETCTHYGFCHKAVALVKIQREFSIGRLCTQLFHLVFASLALFLFYQCSCPWPSLWECWRPSLSMLELTWGFVTDWLDLLGDRCYTRICDVVL